MQIRTSGNVERSRNLPDGVIRSWAGRKEVQDLVDWVAEHSNFPITSRRCHISNLGKMASLLAGVTATKSGCATPLTKDKVRLNEVPSQPAWVSANLPGYRRAVYGCGKPAYRNMLHSYRAVQRARGKIDSQKDDPLPPQCEWSDRLAALTYHHRMNLIRLAKFAQARGFRPREVDDRLRDNLRTDLAERHLRANLDNFMCNTTNAWNTAVTAGAMGPDARRLTPMPRKRPKYIRDAAEYHLDFSKQRAACIRAMTGSDRKKPAGRHEPASLRLRTVKTYTYAIDHFAVAL